MPLTKEQMEAEGLPVPEPLTREQSEAEGLPPIPMTAPQFDIPDEVPIAKRLMSLNNGPTSGYEVRPASEIVGDFVGSVVHPEVSSHVVAGSAQQVKPDAAVQALNDALAHKITPQQAADNAEVLKASKQQAATAQALQQSPTLKAYAAQSPVNASAVAPDATNLAAVARGFFDEQPGEEADDNAPDPDDLTPAEENELEQAAMLPTTYDAISQVLMKHTAGALADFADAIVGIQEKPGEASKTISRELHQAADVDLSKDFPGPAEAVVGVAPSLAIYTAGGAAGKSALFGTAYVQNYGALRRAGVEDWLAIPGAAAAAGIFLFPASKFVSGLIGKTSEKEVQDAAVAAMLNFAKRPEVREIAAARLPNAVEVDEAKAAARTLTEHGVAGYLMTVGSALSNKATEMLSDLAERGKKFDPSELWQTFAEASKQSLSLIPYVGIPALREHFEARGQEVLAHADQTKLAQLTGPLGETNLVKQAPEEVKKIVKGMASEPASAHVDPDTLRKASEKLKLDPEKVTEHATGSPDALREAEAAGTPVKVPIENFAVDLQPMHEDIAKGTSLDPDHPSLAKVEATESFEDALKKLAEPFNNEKLQKIAAQGKQPGPTEAEIHGLFKNLKDLGFKVPDLPNFKLAGQEVPEPKPQAVRKAQAEEIVSKKTLDSLDTREYAKQAERLHRQIVSLHEKAVNALSKAEQTVQQGVDTALEGIRAGNKGVKEASKGIDSMALAGDARVLAEWEKSHLPKVDRSKAGPEEQPSSASTGLYDVGGVKEGPQGPPKPLVDAGADARDLARIRVSDAERHRTLAERQKRLAERQWNIAEDKSLKATGHTVEAGEHLLEAEKLISQRDTNLALENARAKAVAEGERIKAAVGKLSASPTRERLYKSGEIFGQLYDHFMQSTDLRKKYPNARLEDPVNLMEWFQASYGSDMPFNKGHVLDVIEKGQKLGEMTLPEARNARAFAETLNTVARESSKAYVNGALAERSAVIAEDILPALQAQKPKAEPVPINPKQAEPPGKLIGGIREVKRLAGDAAKNNFQTLLHSLGAWGDSHFLRTLNAEKVRRGIDKDVAEALRPSSKLPGLDQRVAWPEGLKVEGLTPDVSRADMLHLRRLTGTVENMRDVAKASGLTPADWEAWFDQHMTEGDYRATQHAWDALEPLGERTAQIHALRGGVPMVRQTPRDITTKFGDFQGKYGGGMRWLDKLGQPPKRVSPLDPMQGNRVAEDTAHGLTETRVPNQGFPDFSATNGRAHFNEQAHDIAFSEVIRDGSRMFKDPDFQRAVTQYMGPEWLSRMVDAHNLMADGGRVTVDRGIGTVNALYLGGRVTASAAFPINWNTAVKMVLHPLQDVAVQGGSLHLLHGVMRSVTGEGRAEANENSRVVPLYTEDSYKQLAQMRRDLEGRSGGVLTKAGDVASFAGTWFQAKIMEAQAHIVWQTHKFEALAKKASPQEAIDFADARTAAAMPANSVFRQSAQNRNQLFASLNLVYNFEGAFWNMKAQQEIERRAGVAAGDNAALSYALRTISRTAGYVALGLGLWAGGQGRNPEEEAEDAAGTGPLGHWQGSVRWAARTLWVEKWFGSPVFHKLAEVTAPMLVGEKAGFHYGAFSPPANDLFEGLWRDFSKTVNSDKPDADRVAAAFSAMARVIPGGVQIARSIKGTYSLLHPEDFMGPAPRGVGDMIDQALRGPNPRNASLISDIQGAVSGQPRQHWRQ